MSTQSIAQDFVGICQSGNFAAAGDKYWSDDVISIEPMGDSPESKGKAAVAGKGEWWVNNHDIHGATVEGPYVSGDQFTVRFAIDVTPKASGQRMMMDEIGIFTVKDDKITREQFIFKAA